MCRVMGFFFFFFFFVFFFFLFFFFFVFVSELLHIKATAQSSSLGLIEKIERDMGMGCAMFKWILFLGAATEKLEPGLGMSEKNPTQ